MLSHDVNDVNLVVFAVTVEAHFSVFITSHNYFRFCCSGQIEKAETLLSAMVKWKCKDFKETLQEGRAETEKGQIQSLPFFSKDVIVHLSVYNQW